MVHHVETVYFNHKIDPLPYMKATGQGRVQIRVSWPAQTVGSSISETIGIRRVRKCRRIEVGLAKDTAPDFVDRPYLVRTLCVSWAITNRTRGRDAKRRSRKMGKCRTQGPPTKHLAGEAMCQPCLIGTKWRLICGSNADVVRSVRTCYAFIAAIIIWIWIRIPFAQLFVISLAHV